MSDGQSDKARLRQLPDSLFQLIRQHTWRDQLWILLLTISTFPLVYLLLELPKRIINEALGSEPVPETFLGIAVDTKRYLLMLCLSFLALVLLNGGIKYALNIYRGVVGERMLRYLRSVLYQRLLHFPNERFRRLSSGEVVPIVVSETEPLGGFIGEAYALPAFQGGLLLTYLFFIFNQNWTLGLLAIAFYPLQMVVIPRLQARINKLIKKRVRTVRRLGEQIEDSVSGIRDIQSLGLMPLRSHQFEGVLQRVYQLRLRIFRLKYLIKFLNNFLAKLTPFFFYLFGGYAVLSGELTLGALIAVLAAYQDLDGPWKELLKYYQVKEDIRVRYEQICRQFTDTLPQLPNTPKTDSDHALSISLAHVSVQGANSYMHDLNIEIPRGHNILIHSQAESALETLALTLAGLHPYTQGSLRLGGRELNTLSLEDLAFQRALVLQRSHMFSGNLRVNSALGIMSHSLSYDNIDLAVLQAYGYESIEQCYDKYRSLIIALGLDSVFLRLGLESYVKPSTHPELTQAIVDARAVVQQTLANANASHFVSRFDPHSYNPNWPLISNLLFDPKLGDNPQKQLNQHMQDKNLHALLKSSGLHARLLDVGEDLLEILLEMLADVPLHSPLWSKFSFFRAEDLAEHRELLARIRQKGVDKLPHSAQCTLLRLVMQLCPTQHRLGLIDEDIQERAVSVRKQLMQQTDNACAFCLEGSYVAELSVRENLLQGSLSLQWGNAQERVDTLIHQALSQSELIGDLVRLGMEHDVGVGGTAINETVRQRHAFLRALLTNPKLLLIHRATDTFGDAMEKRVRDLVLEEPYTVIWLCQKTIEDARFDQRYELTADGLVALSSQEADKALEKPPSVTQIAR